MLMAKMHGFENRLQRMVKIMRNGFQLMPAPMIDVN